MGKATKKAKNYAYKTLTDANVALALVEVFPVPGIAAAKGVKTSKRTKNPKKTASPCPVNVKSTKLKLIKSTWHASTANGKQSAHVCAKKHNAGHVVCARIAAIAIKVL